MVDRIDIERALQTFISDESGMRFQGLAVVLAKLRWPELVARERKNDLGLDAYASARLSPNGIGKGLACSTTPKLSKLRADAEEAKKHFSDISSLIFMTPGKVSGKLESKWACEIREDFGYELTVVSREDLISTLQMPDNASICRTHLGISIPYRPSTAELIFQAREAAGTVTAGWARHPRLAGKPQILLNAITLDRDGGETREIFPTSQLVISLLKGRRLVLEGAAGRGKTTTLIQLARALSGASGIPFLIDLPQWTRSGLDILDYLSRQSAFRARSIDAASLARLAESEPSVFLLNGWNEISESAANDAANALRDLERAFPKSGIVVATRAHHSFLPLPGSTTIRLLALTPMQRLAISSRPWEEPTLNSSIRNYLQTKHSMN